jgi:hypothetical protein
MVIGGFMNVICKSCGVDFEMGKNDDAKCPSCGKSYNGNLNGEKFSIKYLNGLLLENLTYTEVENGILNGKFLSVDYVSTDTSPWMKLKDSPFAAKSSISKIVKIEESSNKSWKILFFLSFIVNLILLGLIYFQKTKLDELIK